MKEQLKFTSKDFYDLLDRQKRRCALTNRELTPLNTEVELIDPNKKVGKFEVKNMYLVDRDLRQLARYLSKNEIIQICKEVLIHNGYKIKK